MKDKNWEEIKHFKPSEFKHPELMSFEFVKLIDEVRTKFGRPLKINSDYRTKEENKKAGGKPTSAHLKGVAIDTSCINDRDRFDLIVAIIECGITRIGMAKTFIHFDMDFDKDQRVIWLY